MLSAFGLANQIIKALEAGLESVTTEPQRPLIISQIDLKTKKP